MQSLETTPVTWKQLPSLELGKDFREMNAGGLPEVTATAGGCSDCKKLWQLLEAARLLEAATGCWRGPQCDGKCSFYFKCHFFHTTPTNRDFGQKAVYFPAWITSITSNEIIIKAKLRIGCRTVSLF